MGTLLDLASLVVVPSGYKEDVVYSVKPTDGSGDLDFTRSNDTATRVNSAGLIEKVRTNLYTHSENFANASWLLIDTVKASTSETDPNGGTTAANITWTAGSGRFFYQSIATSSISTVSFYVKSNGGGNNFRFFANGATIFSSNLTATSTWTRYSFAFTGNGSVSIGISNATDNSAADLLVAFAQLELGDIATDYIPTTTTAVSVGMTANVPRLDYTGGGCPKLLLEPQRTNALTYSEQFNNAAWTPTGVSVTANTAISPSGYQDADTLTFGASASENIYNFPTSAIGANTFSIYAKTASGTKNFRLRIDTGSGPAVSSDFTATTTWQRFTFTATTTATNLVAYIFNDSLGTAGNLLVWGCQLEAGAYATSYIPTLGAAVTRGADACSKTGISSLIGQTEGTLFVEFFYNEENTIPTGSDKSVMRVESGGGYSNAIAILYYGDEGSGYGKTIQCIITNGGTTQSSMTTTQTMVSGYYKVAVSYKANDFAMAVNGVIVATDNSGSVPTCANFSLNESTRIQSDINPKQALLFPTRLTNTQLAELTTL